MEFAVSPPGLLPLKMNTKDVFIFLAPLRGNNILGFTGYHAIFQAGQIELWGDDREDSFSVGSSKTFNFTGYTQIKLYQSKWDLEVYSGNDTSYYEVMIGTYRFPSVHVWSWLLSKENPKVIPINTNIANMGTLSIDFSVGLTRRSKSVIIYQIEVA